MNKITFVQSAWDDYLEWQSNDRQTLKKINVLLKEILRDPFQESGKPEPLKGNLSQCWSRRINEKDRLVYIVAEDEIQIIQCRGHYSDR